MMPFCAASVTASSRPERVEVSPFPVPRKNEGMEEGETDGEKRSNTMKEEREEEERNIEKG